MTIVSVITPIFDVEEFLPRCLESLEAQTLLDAEFICIDDGSTDSSGEIARRFAERDGRFKVVSKENSGYGATMNLGLSMAVGDYVAIVESDDFIAPDALERLAGLARDNGNPDIVKANFYRYSEEGGETFVENFPEGCCGEVIDPAGEHAREVFEAIPAIWSAIYRRDFLFANGIGFLETPGASFQDTGFVFKGLIAAETMLVTYDAFLRYRTDNGGSSVKSAGKAFAICEEFASIERFLADRPAKRERLGSLMAKRKFTAYRWNYRRLAWDVGGEFLERFSSEMAEARRRGLLDRKLFGKGRWLDASCVIDSPASYGNMRRAEGEAADSPAVSVVLACYNSQAHLGETLRCIAEQTLFDIEVICVDDGSTDRTPVILEKFAASDRRFKVVRQANAGAGAARNAGIREACGEYLSIIDAGDLFERDMLACALARAREADADVVVFRSDQFDSKTGKRKKLAHTMRTHLMPAVEPFAGVDLERDAFNVFMGWAWDKLFRREFVEREGLAFQEQRSTNDLLFVFSAIVRARRIATASDVLAHYRRNVGGLSETREEGWDCFYHALVALRSQLREWGLYERFERDFANYCVRLSAWHVKTVAEPARSLMVGKLRGEWLDELGVTGHDADYFYEPRQYRAYLSIMDGSISGADAPRRPGGAESERSLLRKVASAYGADGAKGVARAVRKRFSR